MTSFTSLDTIVFLIYFVVISSYGIWIYWSKKRSSGKATHDFFPYTTLFRSR